jgi:hypothetical protein
MYWGWRNEEDIGYLSRGSSFYRESGKGKLWHRTELSKTLA